MFIQSGYTSTTLGFFRYVLWDHCHLVFQKVMGLGARGSLTGIVLAFSILPAQHYHNQCKLTRSFLKLYKNPNPIFFQAQLPHVKVHAYFAPVTPPPAVAGSGHRLCRCCVILWQQLLRPQAPSSRRPVSWLLHHHHPISTLHGESITGKRLRHRLQ